MYMTSRYYLLVRILVSLRNSSALSIPSLIYRRRGIVKFLIPRLSYSLALGQLYLGYTNSRCLEDCLFPQVHSSVVVQPSLYRQLLIQPCPSFSWYRALACSRLTPWGSFSLVLRAHGQLALQDSGFLLGFKPSRQPPQATIDVACILVPKQPRLASLSIGISLVASLAKESASLFSSISICPGTQQKDRSDPLSLASLQALSTLICLAWPSRSDLLASLSRLALLSEQILYLKSGLALQLAISAALAIASSSLLQTSLLGPILVLSLQVGVGVRG